MSDSNVNKDELNTEINENEMPSSAALRGKVIIGVILMIVLSVVCGVIAGRYDADVQKEKNLTYQQEYADHALSALSETLEREETRTQVFHEHLYRSAELMRDMLMSFVDEYNEYTGPETFADGIVIRMENGRVIWPVGFRDGDIELPEGFPEAMESDLFDSKVMDGDEPKDAVVLIRQLCTDTWYLEWTYKSEEESFLDAYVGRDRYLKAIESVMDGWLYVADSDDPSAYIYNGMQFDEQQILSAFKAAKAGEEEVNVEGVRYCPFIREIPEKNLTMLYLVYTSAINSHSPLTGVIAGLAVFMILAVMYVWLISTRRMVNGHILTKPQSVRYNPKAVRRRTAAAGALSVIAVFGLSLLFGNVKSVYEESLTARQRLNHYENAITAFNDRLAEINAEEADWTNYYAGKIADMFSQYPELINHVRLAMLNSTIGSEYIMVFDHEGTQIACSGDYVGFTLGEDEEDPLYQFRRITMGLENIITQPAKDIILDKDTSLCAYRIDMSESEGYGVLLISSDAAKQNSLLINDRTESGIMAAAVRNDSLLLSLDEEMQNTEHASLQYMEGIPVSQAGLSENDLKESTLSPFTLHNVEYYGLSRFINGKLHYYLFESGAIGSDALKLALLCTALAFVSFVIFTIYLLSGYTQEEFKKNALIGREAVIDSSVEVITPDGRIKRSRDPSRRWALSFFEWKDLLPENKTRVAARVILAVYLAALLIFVFISRGSMDSMTSYLLGGSWEKGFNIFALSASLLILAAALLGLSVLSLVVRLACSWLDTKGETILRLLFNLFQYAVMFTVLFYIFSNFGVDTSALLTTMGLVSLAVSIGARDLVTDIIAGITIVFEGDYQVGDIVEIDGYRGKVQEIGVRSTKIMGLGDNIKIINNRDVKNVINTTRFNSWYAMSLNIASSFDIQKLEEILDKELPEIHRRVRKSISGPIYKGVESIGKDSFRITILTECREEDFRRVQRQINREIRMLCDREGIPII